MMSSSTYDKADLDLAIHAAKEAGKYLLDNFMDSNLIIESEKGKDIKLAVDKGSEQIILEIIQSVSDYSILSEEVGNIYKENSQLVWLIDPLDGSLNYSRRIAINCVSIGLWRDNEPLMGVIYDFLNDDLFCGDPNGATLNGHTINVSSIVEKGKSIICTGFPSYNSLTNLSLTEFINKVKQYKKVRLLGSAAMSLALVAKGSAEAYTEERIGFWDVAAGIAILRAAGGDVKFDFVDNRGHYLNVYATNGVQTI
jgi:myo-inositol-1(or 4)-monophosphatase